jgi:hypothetical protein
LTGGIADEAAELLGSIVGRDATAAVLASRSVTIRSLGEAVRKCMVWSLL